MRVPNPKYADVTPIKIIRAKCVDCSGGSIYEPTYCQVFDCPAWLWRLGKRPKTVAKTRPELLDPEAVRRLAERKCRSEMLSEGSRVPDVDSDALEAAG